MTEEDVLARLRDIHLPAELTAAASVQLAVWPFVVLAIAIGTLLSIRLWNRHRWRRRAEADLESIIGLDDQAAQWSGLLAFAGDLPERTGRKVRLPDVAYRRPENITNQDREALIAFVGAELRR